jgi:hypothetical protein
MLSPNNDNSEPPSEFGVQTNNITNKTDKLCYNDSIKKLARKINRVKDKNILIAIINIIKIMNPTVSITENENGMFIKFNTLSPQTYTKLENYLHKNLRKSLEDSDNLTTSEYVPYSPDEINTSNDKYKLSNREKTLIKKQKYSHLVQ